MELKPIHREAVFTVLFRALQHKNERPVNNNHYVLLEFDETTMLLNNVTVWDNANERDDFVWEVYRKPGMYSVNEKDCYLTWDCRQICICQFLYQADTE